MEGQLHVTIGNIDNACQLFKTKDSNANNADLIL